MTTRWRPDTCDCAFDVVDWDAPKGTTVITCRHHRGLVDDAHLDAVLNGENRVKNKALAAIEADVTGASDGAVVSFVSNGTSARACEIALAPAHSQATRARLGAKVSGVTVR